jgi:hypothetical protein
MVNGFSSFRHKEKALTWSNAPLISVNFSGNTSIALLVQKEMYT